MPCHAGFVKQDRRHFTAAKKIKNYYTITSPHRLDFSPLFRVKFIFFSGPVKKRDTLTTVKGGTSPVTGRNCCETQGHQWL